jgi:hypothetical protein
MTATAYSRAGVCGGSVISVSPARKVTVMLRTGSPERPRDDAVADLVQQHAEQQQHGEGGRADVGASRAEAVGQRRPVAEDDEAANSSHDGDTSTGTRGRGRSGRRR